LAARSQTGEIWDAATGRPTAPIQIRFLANLYQQDVDALRKLATQFAADNLGVQIIFTDYPQVTSTSTSGSGQDNLLAAFLGENDCFVDWTMPGEYSRRASCCSILPSCSARPGPS